MIYGPTSIKISRFIIYIQWLNPPKNQTLQKSTFGIALIKIANTRTQLNTFIIAFPFIAFSPIFFLLSLRDFIRV
jgi:hypothetical protein